MGGAGKDTDAPAPNRSPMSFSLDKSGTWGFNTCFTLPAATKPPYSGS
jgi:hypothetical protein